MGGGGGGGGGGGRGGGEWATGGVGFFFNDCFRLSIIDILAVFENDTGVGRQITLYASNPNRLITLLVVVSVVSSDCRSSVTGCCALSAIDQVNTPFAVTIK